MSSIEIAGLALAAIPIIATGSARFRDVREIITLRSLEDSLRHGQNSLWVSLYGYWRTLFLQLAFPDALNLIGRIHKDVIQDGTLHAATLTRDAMCAKYNMTAVAVSIFNFDMIARGTHLT